MRKSYGVAIRVALTYAVVAATWILVSGVVVALLPKPIESLMEVGKGLAFVVVTAFALYWIVLRWSDRVREEAEQRAGAERLLAQVVETVPVGVLIVADDRTVTYLNPGAEHLLDAKAEECIGRPLDELCASQAATELNSVRVGDLLRTGAADGIEVGSEHHPRTLAARAAAVDESQPASGWIVALADITDSHIASERAARLLKSHRFLSQAAVAMMRSSSETQMLSEVAAFALEEGPFAASWALLRRHSGGPAETAAIHNLGESARDVVRRISESPLDEHGGMLDLLRDGEIVVNNDLARDPASPWNAASIDQGLASVAALGVFGPNGTVVALTLFSAMPGFFDADQIALLRNLRNEMAFVVEKLHLERLRTEAEEALGMSEAGYRSLFQSNPQPMWVYDIETLAFLAVNDAALRKYGYTAEQFKAMTIADIRPPEDVPLLRENVAQVTEGFDDAGIWSHVDRDGRVFPVHIYSHTIDWEGRRAELVMAQEVARME